MTCKRGPPCLLKLATSPIETNASVCAVSSRRLALWKSDACGSPRMTFLGMSARMSTWSDQWNLGSTKDTFPMKVLIKWPSNFYSVFKVYRELLTRSNIIECFANEAILRYNITNKQTIFYQTLNQQNKLVFSGLRTPVMLVTLCYSSQNIQVTLVSVLSYFS